MDLGEGADGGKCGTRSRKEGERREKEAGDFYCVITQ